MINPIEGAVGVPHPSASAPLPELPRPQRVTDAVQRKAEELLGREEKRAQGYIYDHPADDHERSAKYGRKCYKMIPYIQVRAPGVTDYMSYKLTEQHKRDYPEAWEKYQERRRHTAEGLTKATILPSVDPAVWKELQELGMYWVQDIPDEIPGLEKVCADAQMFKRLAKPRLRLVKGQLVEVT